MTTSTAALAHLIAAPLLSVVSSQPSPAPGSAAWAKEVRTDAQITVKALEQGYLHLGELLHVVEHMRVDGLDHGPFVFTTWGYDRFEHWVEKDLGIHIHKARSLARIYRRMAELTGLDPAVRERVLRLGWTKVREVIRVLTLSNAAEWAQLGEAHNYHDFREAVAKYADALQQKDIDEKKARMVAAAAKITPGELAAADAQDAKTAGLPIFTAGAEFEETDDDDQDDGTAGVPMPEPELTVPFNFALYPEQAQTLRDAIAMAKSHNPGKPNSYYLEVIALEYLATYFAGNTPREKKAVAIARLGELMGLRVVAQDPETGEIVHGGDGPLATALRAGEV